LWKVYLAFWNNFFGRLANGYSAAGSARRSVIPKGAFGSGELAAQGARRPLVKKAVSIDQALAEIRSQGRAREASAVAS
jgi:hypothetical protein